MDKEPKKIEYDRHNLFLNQWDGVKNSQPVQTPSVPATTVEDPRPEKQSGTIHRLIDRIKTV